AGSAIVGPDADAAIRIVGEADVRGGLVARLRRYFDPTAAAEPPIADALPGGDEAGDARDVLGTADRLQIFLDHLIDRRHASSLRDHIVGFIGRRTVHHIQRGRDHRPIAAAIAG